MPVEVCLGRYSGCGQRNGSIELVKEWMIELTKEWIIELINE
jgi:hypothetical protein